MHRGRDLPAELEPSLPNVEAFVRAVAGRDTLHLYDGEYGADDTMVESGTDPDASRAGLDDVSALDIAHDDAVAHAAPAFATSAAGDIDWNHGATGLALIDDEEPADIFAGLHDPVAYNAKRRATAYRPHIPGPFLRPIAQLRTPDEVWNLRVTALTALLLFYFCRTPPSPPEKSLAVRKHPQIDPRECVNDYHALEAWTDRREEVTLVRLVGNPMYIAQRHGLGTLVRRCFLRSR